MVVAFAILKILVASTVNPLISGQIDQRMVNLEAESRMQSRRDSGQYYLQSYNNGDIE